MTSKILFLMIYIENKPCVSRAQRQGGKYEIKLKIIFAIFVIKVVCLCIGQGSAEHSLNATAVDYNLNSGTVHLLLFLIPPTNAHKCLLQ